MIGETGFSGSLITFPDIVNVDWPALLVTKIFLLKVKIIVSSLMKIPLMLSPLSNDLLLGPDPKSPGDNLLVF